MRGMTELVPGAVGIVVSAPRPEVRAASRALSSRGARARVVILDAALEVAARTGLGRASLAAVAACAGTSKTSVLYHFRSLQGLHREMAACARELMQAAVQAAAASCTGSPTERAEQLTDARIGWPAGLPWPLPESPTSGIPSWSKSTA